VVPASGEYVLGHPLAGRARLTLAGGRVLEIVAPDADRDDAFAASARLRGGPPATRLSHAALLGGGTLGFQSARGR
jgi:putative alpha-1,2-mannosidase